MKDHISKGKVVSPSLSVNLYCMRVNKGQLMSKPA